MTEVKRMRQRTQGEHSRFRSIKGQMTQNASGQPAETFRWFSVEGFLRTVCDLGKLAEGNSRKAGRARADGSLYKIKI